MKNQLDATKEARAALGAILVKIAIELHGSQLRLTTLLGQKHTTSVRKWMSGTGPITLESGQQIAPLLGVSSQQMETWFQKIEYGEAVTEAEIRKAVSDPESKALAKLVARGCEQVKLREHRTILLGLVNLSDREYFELLAIAGKIRGEESQKTTITHQKQMVRV
jgi:hypothetical protein